jgi:catechol 2,3-dioxygenase-like lactoylglutathione lyase family enzyme
MQMEELGGINHVTFVTQDLDRLVAFYEEAFGAHKLLELPIPYLKGRHAFVDVGGGSVLHPFEIPGQEQPSPDLPMFARGRVDHFALQVPRGSLDRLGDRLVGMGVSTGEITDFGVVRVLSFKDPDGLHVELGEWVGGDNPADLDMSSASDQQLFVKMGLTAAGH